MIDLRLLDKLREPAFDRYHGLPSDDETRRFGGAFRVPVRGVRQALLVIASSGEIPDGPPWDHVSASFRHRCPTWEEMCQVKELFFASEDVVMQLHPAASQNISNHRYCLHLWRPLSVEIPLPPSFLVGVAALGELHG